MSLSIYIFTNQVCLPFATVKLIKSERCNCFILSKGVKAVERDEIDMLNRSPLVNLAVANGQILN